MHSSKSYVPSSTRAGIIIGGIGASINMIGFTYVGGTCSTVRIRLLGCWILSRRCISSSTRKSIWGGIASSINAALALSYKFSIDEDIKFSEEYAVLMSDVFGALDSDALL